MSAIRWSFAIILGITLLIGGFIFMRSAWNHGFAEEEHGMTLQLSQKDMRAAAERRLLALKQLEEMSSNTSLTAIDSSGIETSSSQWTPIGPRPTNNVVSRNYPITSGQVTALAVDPNNDNVVYLGAANGGVWKSIDGGSTWNPKTDFAPSLSIGAIAIDPSNTRVVYAGTGEANFSAGARVGVGILKSLDAGATWIHLPGLFVGNRVASLAVSPSSPQVLLAATDSGVYRSADAGVSWERVLVGYGRRVQFDSSGLVAHATLDGYSPDRGIHKSVDGGLKWFSANGSGPTALPLDGSSRIEMAVAPSNPQLVYVALAKSDGSLLGFYKSANVTNSGYDWVRLGPKFLGLPDYCYYQCDYDHVIAVHPKDPNVVFAGGAENPLFRSLDGGSSWKDVRTGSNSVLHEDLHALAFSADGSKIYVGTDGGVWSTSGATVDCSFLFCQPPIIWSNLNSTLSITEFNSGVSIYTNDPSIALAGTQDNGLQRYLGSQTWETVDCGDGGWTVIDPTNSAAMYATCAGVSRFRGLKEIWIKKSVLGGNPNSWYDAQTGIDSSEEAAFYKPLVMDPSARNRLYFGATRVYQTTDFAGVWRSISNALGLPISALTVAPSDPRFVYAGDIGGSLYATSKALDASQVKSSWVSSNPSPPGPRLGRITQITVQPTDPMNGFATFANEGGSGVVFSFTFSGNQVSWKSIAGNLPDIPMGDIVVDPDVPNVLYLATDVGVFVTNDGGQIWVPLSSGLPHVPVVDLGFHRATRTLRAATHGRGMWDIHLPLNSTLPHISINKLRILDYQNKVTNSVAISPGTSSGEIALEISRYAYPGAVAITLSGLPPRVTPTISGPGLENTAKITLQASSTVTPFLHQLVTLTASSASTIPVTTTVDLNVLPLPTVSTQAATVINEGSVAFNGIVNPNGTETKVAFEWSTKSDFSTYATVSVGSSREGNTSATIRTTLSGLQIGITYYYRIVGANAAGASRGLILSVTPVSSSNAAVPTITTVAGNGQIGFSGDGGPAINASLKNVQAVAVDAAGDNIYVLDDSRIRKVDINGTITTVATLSSCCSRPSMKIDPVNNLYVLDLESSYIWKVTQNGQVSTIPIVPSGSTYDFAIDSSRNIYYTLSTRNVIGRIDSTGTFSNFAGAGCLTNNNLCVAGYSGDGGPASGASLNYPIGIAADRFGNVFVLDWGNYRIRKVNSAGIITTIAGNGTKGVLPSEGELATTTSLNSDYSRITVDPNGSVYFVQGHSVWKIARSGIISKLAGSQVCGFSGDGGPATTAALCFPFGLASDRHGNVYVADYGNNRIRKIATGLQVNYEGKVYDTALSFSGIYDAANLGAPVTISIGVTNTGNTTVDNLWLGADIMDQSGAVIEQTKTPVNLGAGIDFGGAQGQNLAPRASRIFNASYVLGRSSKGTLYRVGLYRLVFYAWKNGYPGQSGAETLSDLQQAPLAVLPIDFDFSSGPPTTLISGQTFSVARDIPGVRLGDQVIPAGPAIAPTHLDIHWHPTDPGSPSSPNGGIPLSCNPQSIACRQDLLGSQATLTAPAVSTPTQLKYVIHTIYNGEHFFSPMVTAVVSPVAPQITGTSIDAARQGSTVSAAINGTNLGGTVAVTFTSGDVVAAIEPGGTWTTVPITISISSSAPTGKRTFTVTTLGGNSAPYSEFTVTAGTPIITAIDPSSAATGTTASITLMGTSLGGATAITFSGTGVIATINTGGTDGTLPATIVIAPDAALGTRTVTVTTPAGTSTAFAGFTVTSTPIRSPSAPTGPVLEKWADTAFPILWRLNPARGDNITGSRDLADVFRLSFGGWGSLATTRVSFLEGQTTAVTSAAFDGINTISTIPSQYGSDALSLTVIYSFKEPGVDQFGRAIQFPGQILEADVLFNPAIQFSTDLVNPVDKIDLQSCATHEVGHLLGVDHSGLLSAVMSPILMSGRSQLRTLTSDDGIRVSTIYPDSSFFTLKGGSRGVVRNANGSPVYGAHVVIVDSVGRPVTATFTDPDGVYQVNGLEPGTYSTYAEPLDGPLIASAVPSLARMDIDKTVADNFTTRFAESSSPTTLLTMTKTAGDNQKGTAGRPLSIPLEVLVQDGSGSPIGGVRVSFAPTGGGGTVVPIRASTDTQGKARTQAYLGSGATQTFTVSVSTISVTFTATIPLP